MKKIESWPGIIVKLSLPFMSGDIPADGPTLIYE